MTGFNHIATGVVIAVSVQHPVLAPILSLVSHFILDALPHYDPGYYGPREPYGKQFKPYLIIETLLIPAVLVTSIIIFQNHWLLVLVCALLAYAPDILWAFEKRYGQQKLLKKFYEFHNKIQWGERPWGWTIESVYFFAIGFILLNQ
ncbi:MAG TPA: hypothetical protein VFZ58_03315 [Candidatus Saccharimonadales bacterium]